MRTRALEQLIWALIFVGLFVAGIGVWYLEHSIAVGSTVLVAGTGAAVLGALLIWVRSRRP